MGAWSSPLRERAVVLELGVTVKGNKGFGDACATAIGLRCWALELQVVRAFEKAGNPRG